MKKHVSPDLVRLVETAALSPSGEQVELSTNVEQRAALAKALGILEVTSFKSDLRIAQWKKVGVQFSGRISIEVVHSCVVSLEPVPRKMELEILRQFLPPGKTARKNERFDGEELIIDPHSEDEPDELEGNQLDLWEVIVEEIFLNLDEFPRSESAKNSGLLVSEEEVSTPNQDHSVSDNPTYTPFSDLDTLISQKKSET